MSFPLIEPLAYESHGDAKPSLVFIHGFPFDRRMWERQVRLFKQTNRVVTIDLAGFGDSRLRSSAADGGEYSMANLSDQCCECLDRAGIVEPVVLCGLSMGGYVALEFWHRHPDRLRGLVLSNTRAAADSPEVAANRMGIASKVLEVGTETVVMPMLEKLLSRHTREEHPEIVASLASMMVSVKPETIEAAQTAMAHRRDFQDLLEKIKIPCLVIAGEDDIITPPAEMERMAARLPNADFVVIPKVGHMTPIESEVAFNKSLEQFLIARC